jgi:hypothetical protein
MEFDYGSNEDLRFRDLGKNVVALSRKALCRLRYIAFGQSQPYAIDQPVIEIKQRRHQHVYVVRTFRTLGLAI